MSQEGKEEVKANMSLSLFKSNKRQEAVVVSVDGLKKKDGKLKKQKPKLEEEIKAEYLKFQRHTVAAKKKKPIQVIPKLFDQYASHKSEKKWTHLLNKLHKLKRDEFDVEIQITLRSKPEAEKEPIYDDDLPIKAKPAVNSLRKDMTMNTDELRGTMQLKPLAKFGRSLKKPFTSMKSNLSKLFV